ncbi:MAG: hypothetical protein VX335_05375, partial [Pseudomonadota bacterium]|nr:hypothetical protein [Pseudomonadota bacterium]
MADMILIEESAIDRLPSVFRDHQHTDIDTKDTARKNFINVLNEIPVNDQNKLDKAIDDFLIEKTDYTKIGIASQTEYKSSLSQWVKVENNKYKDITDDDVIAYNGDQSKKIHNKIINAQQNFAKKVTDLVENSIPGPSPEDLQNAEEQLKLIEDTYKGKREMELSSVLYFGMPIAQAGPTLSIISAAAAGAMLFLTPVVILAYSLTYTVNNIKHEGSYTFNSKLLIGLSALALATTALAFVSFAGITLPITGPAIVGIASTINFGLFLWSFKLESDRNNAAADLLNTKITRLESSLVEITDADPNAETKRKLVNQSIKVMLYQYTDLVRTIKAPWSKQTHLKNLENFKTSIAHRTINIHMGIIDFSTKRNLTTQKNTYIDNIKEALKEQGINPNLVDEIKNVRIDDDGTTSLRGRSQMNMDDFLKKASIGVDGKVDETKYQELKKIVQRFEIDRNLITLVNSKKQMFVDDTKIDKISI